jgi:hypothetical protein
MVLAQGRQLIILMSFQEMVKNNKVCKVNIAIYKTFCGPNSNVGNKLQSFSLPSLSSLV